LFHKTEPVFQTIEENVKPELLIKAASVFVIMIVEQILGKVTTASILTSLIIVLWAIKILPCNCADFTGIL